jgi:TonB family protein
VKELNILKHAKEKAFDEATLKAIREWRFQPLMQNGQAIEVVHELTVFYELVYR